MPDLPVARPHRSPPHVQLPPTSPVEGSNDDTPFACACRELLRLHEDEVRVLHERVKELQRLKLQTAIEGVPAAEQLAIEAVPRQASPGQSTITHLSTPSSKKSERDAIAGARPPSVRSSWSADRQQAAVEVSKSISDELEQSTHTSRISSQPNERGTRLTHVAVSSTDRLTNAGMLQMFVSGHFFEVVSCSMVVCNALVLGFEAQYHGQSIGHTLEYRDHVLTAEDQYPHGEVVLDILSWVFGTFFALEVVLRMCASLRMSLRDAWWWFDAFVVTVWLISTMDYVLPVDSTVLRLARILRLLRLLKLARALQHFDSLYIIVTASKSCLSVLFWTFVTFGLVQLLLSLSLVQYLHLFYFPSPDNSPERVLVFTYYGTFVRSYFSLWEITLGNWPPAIRILAEHVSEYFFMFGLMHKLVFGFAIVGIINGVFIQETFKVTAKDDVIMLRQKKEALKDHVNKMRRLMNHADIDGDGNLSSDEWDIVMQDSGVKMWLSSMDLSVYDARLIFRLCDVSSDGYLSFDELVNGIARFKGPAKSIDLHAFVLQQAQGLRRVSSTLA
eukprot:TRINITY_DN8467_c1_g1_i1.p1 TRINITY_DN8467_c1_g1~~TRINITY_DN8467_c1_g1_i1.p1  ORF type:complete len:559 (+),score=58.06 TRINITY_DN8467_c1_g1_i1:53-1729(+)